MTMFEAVKQLELDNFCDLMYGAARSFDTQEKFKAALRNEIGEKELQQINDAALQEGYCLIHKTNIIPQSGDK